jgi:glutamate N-acetyltransferase/amino-acid N-acetyltransferase
MRRWAEDVAGVPGQGGRQLVQLHQHRRRYLHQRCLRLERHRDARQQSVAPLDGTDGAAALSEAVSAVCADLATAIVRDGEGATKLVSVEVNEARSAPRRAPSLTPSPIRRWSRPPCSHPIRTGVASLPPSVEPALMISQSIGCASGSTTACWSPLVARAPGYEESEGRRVMAQQSFSIRVSLGRGDAKARVLTCDLSYDYVRINAEYRS